MVTAAHCLYDEEEQLPTAAISVILGVHDRSQANEERRLNAYFFVTKKKLDLITMLKTCTRRQRISVTVFIHEDFVSGSHENDIALLRLGRS